MSGQKFGIAAMVLCLSLVFTTGCTLTNEMGVAPANRVFLSVDFQPDQVLRYEFHTQRNVTVDWTPDKTDGAGKKKSKETVEMVVAYEPVEVETYGLSKIKATFESVTGGGKGRAVKALAGESYTFTIGPDGKIHDRGELMEVLKKASRSAFRENSGGAIKEPDLLDDVLATQWYLWDSVSSIEKHTKGLAVGDKWKSTLMIPTSMVLRKGRSVTYELADIRQSERGRLAVINSTYAMSESKPDVPLPYEGSFRLAGTFGFFRAMFKGFSVKNLEGTGRELFNIDTGRIESCEQNYNLTLKPNAAPLPGANPLIYIKQKITAELIEP